MLVLSRKVGERILIGDQVTVTVVRITGGGVRLGIEAPAEMAVIREELEGNFRPHDTPRTARPTNPS
jgi:carbon storage regulator